MVHPNEVPGFHEPEGFRLPDATPPKVKLRPGTLARISHKRIADWGDDR